jgi:hypothetical protein
MNVLLYDNSLRNLPQNLMEDARAEVAQVSANEETRAALIEEEAKKIATEHEHITAAATAAATTSPTDTIASARRADADWEKSIIAEESKKPGVYHISFIHSFTTHNNLPRTASLLSVHLYGS